jgi:hypothetical protein
MGVTGSPVKDRKEMTTMAASDVPHPGRWIREPSPPLAEPVIEGLVLHGVDAPRAVSLGPGVRDALLRMFHERGAPPGAVPGMAVTLAHGLRAAPGEDAAHLALRVAEAVYAAMSDTSTETGR